jgi:hypothetical protein
MRAKTIVPAKGERLIWLEGPNRTRGEMKQRVVIWGQRVEVDKPPHHPRWVAYAASLALSFWTVPTPTR